VTALVGAIIATYQTDLKKTLAYSTISHCGVLFFLLTLPNLWYFLVYLVLHGVFKSASFICAGELILFNHNYQDWRKIGGNLIYNKLYLFSFIFCLANLSSLPCMLGFFNKNIFLFCGVVVTTGFSYIFILILFCVGVCSLVYFSRIIYFVFHGRIHQHLKSHLVQGELLSMMNAREALIRYIFYIIILLFIGGLLYLYYNIINFYIGVSNTIFTDGGMYLYTYIYYMIHKNLIFL